jgi:hypothetical protein
MSLMVATVDAKTFCVGNGVVYREMSGDDLDYLAKKMWGAHSKHPGEIEPLVDFNSGDNVRERANVSKVSSGSLKALGIKAT